METRIYDISQPVFGCCVYPGDSRPERRRVRSMEQGELYNLTDFSMCAHNGTHVDAPLHFFRDGKGIDRIGLEKFVGPAFVAACEGELGAAGARALLDRAAAACGEARKKLLLKGAATVTPAAARVFAAAGLDLIGCEAQSVGPEDAPMEVHLILLGAEVVLLEGIRLSEVPEGVYLLNCAPLKLEDADGAPCRALLLPLPEQAAAGAEPIPVQAEADEERREGMLYCERCKRVFEAAGRCPSCGGRKLRHPLPEDPCFLTETDPMFGGMLKDVLEQNRIPVIGSSTLGAGLALRVGSMFERVRFYVPFERLPEAEELVEALFRAPAEGGPALEDE